MSQTDIQRHLAESEPVGQVGYFNLKIRGISRGILKEIDDIDRIICTANRDYICCSGTVSIAISKNPHGMTWVAGFGTDDNLGKVELFESG